MAAGVLVVAAGARASAPSSEHAAAEEADAPELSPGLNRSAQAAEAELNGRHDALQGGCLGRSERAQIGR